MKRITEPQPSIWKASLAGEVRRFLSICAIICTNPQFRSSGVWAGSAAIGKKSSGDGRSITSIYIVGELGQLWPVSFLEKTR